MILSSVHRIFSLFILFSSLVLPKLLVFWLLTAILYSWLVFNGCFVNTIEAKIGEAKHHQTKGSIARLMGVHDDDGKHKISLIVNFIWYANYVIMSYRVGMFTEGLLLLILYFMINGQFESPSQKPTEMES